MRIGGVFAVLVAIAALPGTASAQASKDDVARADLLFRDAQILVQKGQLAEGCAKYAESQRLDPGNGTLMNLALCHEKEGRFATAYRELQDLLGRVSRGKSADDRDRTRVALDRLRVLEKKVPRVIFDVSALPKDAVVMLDAEPLKDPLVPTLLDPGRHFVETTAEKKQPGKRTIEIKDPGVQTIQLEPLEDDGPPQLAPLATPAPAPPPEPPEREKIVFWTGSRVAGVVVMGAGVAALAGSAFFGLETFAKRDERDRRCVGTVCDEEGIRLHDEATTAATVSTIGFVAGLLGVGVGAYAFATARSKVVSSGARSPSIQVGVGPGDVVLRGTF